MIGSSQKFDMKMMCLWQELRNYSEDLTIEISTGKHFNHNNFTLSRHATKYQYFVEDKERFNRITPEKIAEYGDGFVKPEDIRVLRNKYNYALDDKHPLDYVKYYNEDEINSRDEVRY